MAVYKTNFNDMPQDNLLPAGEYEVYVASCYTNATKGGTEYLDLQLQVRDDIDQPCKNRKIFESLWLSAKAFEITQRSMNLISKLCGVPDDKEYQTLNEWGADITGKMMRVRVYHQKGNDGYPDKARINKWSESTAPEPMGPITGRDEAMKAVAVLKTGGGFQTVADSDLPF